ncbi:MAG: hypothetical protein IIX93_00080 [Clostridia bacterium]|nr:hypothetical protein [Clostridia bacterium]MBQ2434234.1 hypothetical protein [Clostridia bacterium]
MSKEKNVKKVSFFNWFITLIFSLIPGLNLIFFIGAGMFARNPSKRTYAAAALVLTLIILIGLCVAVIFFGNEIVEWAEKVLAEAEKTTPVIQ